MCACVEAGSECSVAHFSANSKCATSEHLDPRPSGILKKWCPAWRGEQYSYSWHGFNISLKKIFNFPISFFFPLNQLFILRVTTPLLPPAPQYTGLVGYGTFQSVSLLNTKQHFLTKTTLQMKSGQVLDTHITYKLTITDLGNEQTVRKPIILMLDHRDTQLHRMGKQ